MELAQSRPDLAVRYAEEGVRRAPDDARSLMVLGLVQGVSDSKREAKETLRRAAGLARRQGDSALERDIEKLRREVDSPLFSLLLHMGPLLGDLDLDDDPFL
jgi:hypothetical protein